MATVNETKRLLAAAIEKLEASTGDAAAFKRQEVEVTKLEDELGRATAAQKRAANMARPHGGAGGDTPDGAFKSLGEQLLAIAKAGSGHGTDPRLTRAPAGMGETDPSGGGFAIQPEFASEILARAYDMGEILSRARKMPITVGNGIKIPGIDETSRATGSRWGGVQSYWVGEGDAANATKPKFRLIELDLKKLMSIWYVTDEMMADAPALSAIAEQAFTEEVTFMIEDSMVRGTGAGMPMGILNSPALISVGAEKGQAAKTLLYQNVLNMWMRMFARSRQDAVWFINQDVEPQLYALNQVIGTGGVPVYLPPGGVSAAPNATLMGRPVIPVEYCDTLGNVGDIILSDFSQYVLAEKNSPQLATSMHVRFTTDEMAFRITYRVDGEPIWQAPLTPYKGIQTRSPFVALAAR